MKPSTEQALQMAQIIVQLDKMLKQYYPEAVQSKTA
jgi:hypothetical protein